MLYLSLSDLLEHIPKVLPNLNQEDSMAQLLSDIDNPIGIVLENEPDSIESENKGDKFGSSANEATVVSRNTCGSDLKKKFSVAPDERKNHYHSLTIHTTKNLHIHIFFQQKNLALK